MNLRGKGWSRGRLLATSILPWLPLLSPRLPNNDFLLNGIRRTPRCATRQPSPAETASSVVTRLTCVQHLTATAANGDEPRRPFIGWLDARFSPSNSSTAQVFMEADTRSPRTGFGHPKRGRRLQSELWEGINKSAPCPDLAIRQGSDCHQQARAFLTLTAKLIFLLSFNLAFQFLVLFCLLLGMGIGPVCSYVCFKKKKKRSFRSKQAPSSAEGFSLFCVTAMALWICGQRALMTKCRMHPCEASRQLCNHPATYQDGAAGWDTERQISTSGQPVSSFYHLLTFRIHEIKSYQLDSRVNNHIAMNITIYRFNLLSTFKRI